MRIFLSTLILLCPTLAYGGCPVRARVACSNVVVANTVVTPVAVAVPVPVVIPLYGASYTPAPQAPSTDLTAIMQRLDALDKRLNEALAPTKLEPNAKAVPKTENHPGLAVLVTKCASCHDTSKAQANAKGLAFMDGPKLSDKITDGVIASALIDIYKGSMPKKGDKLTDQELADVVDYLDSLKTKK